MLFEADEAADMEQLRLDMLARVSGFKPQETVFEVGKRGKGIDEIAEVIQKRRARVESAQQAKNERRQEQAESAEAKMNGDGHVQEEQDADSDDEELVLTQPGADMDEASDSELKLTFGQPDADAKGKKSKTWQDSEHFMSYTPSTLNLAEDRGYGVHSGGVNVGGNFVTEAAGASMDLANDESKCFAEANKPKGLRWDKKSKKYVQRANDEDGSKGKRFITGESGQKIAASFRSGRFDAWRKANKVSHMPRVGELEKSNSHFAHDRNGGKRFKHKDDRAPKEADKFRDDYHKQKKKVDVAKEQRRGRFAEGKGKNELRGAEDVRKLRQVAEKKKEKNARPQRKGR